LNILLVPEVNYLLSNLSQTGDNQMAKENICRTLNFILILITSIGYYGENEEIKNISEVVRKSILIFYRNLSVV